MSLVASRHHFFKRSPQSPFLPLKQFNYLTSMSEPQVLELLGFSEKILVPKLLENLNQKKVLFLGVNPIASLDKSLSWQSPALLVEYGWEQKENSVQSKLDFHSVRGPQRPFALQSHFFDFAYLSLVTSPLFSLDMLIKEISRVLAPQGRVLLSVPHPSFQIMRLNQNPSSGVHADQNFETYFSLLKKNNLYLEAVVETSVDPSIKPFFVVGENDSYYEEFLGFPLALFLQAVKYEKHGC